jgi:hypothetical protein
MNLDRFQTLADAFGGSITRWPVDVQDAAFAFTAASPDAAALALAAARDLDDDLDGAERFSPGAALRQRIIDAAPTARRPLRTPFQRWLAGAGVGAGLAAATAAGLIAGVNLSAASAGEDALLMAAAYSSGLLVDEGDPS